MWGWVISALLFEFVGETKFYGHSPPPPPPNRHYSKNKQEMTLGENKTTEFAQFKGAAF